MSSSEEHTKKLSPPTRGVQGPKPPTLKVGKNSSKIKKQHVVGPDHHRPPVIIHVKSPEVFHVEARDFMNTVQRLTGCSSSSLPSSALPCMRGSVGCNSKMKVDKKIEGELEPAERNVEVDHTFLVCDEMCSSGPPFGPLPTPSSVSFFTSSNAYPDCYSFDEISDAPYYQDPSFGSKI